jgi:hypothetical protein
MSRPARRVPTAMRFPTLYAGQVAGLSESKDKEANTAGIPCCGRLSSFVDDGRLGDRVQFVASPAETS